MHGAILAQAMLLGLGFEAANQAALEQFHNDVQQAARQTRTLFIEFRIKQHDPVIDQTEEYVGVLKLRRLANGKVLARFEAKPKGNRGVSTSILLVKDDLYLLHSEEKNAVKFDLSKEDKIQIFGTWFNPFLLALDKERLHQQYRLWMRKRDEWYTYLAIEPKSKPRGWLAGINQKGCVVVMNKASDEIPKGMPRQFRFENGSRESIIEIDKWKVNSPHGPKEADFQRPEKMAGWKILNSDEVRGREPGR
jgi:hypothetical protein